MKKDHFIIITCTSSHFIKRIIFALYMYYDNTNKWIAVTKINKSASKETFVEASKVVIKPLKVVN